MLTQPLCCLPCLQWRLRCCRYCYCCRCRRCRGCSSNAAADRTLAGTPGAPGLRLASRQTQRHCSLPPLQLHCSYKEQAMRTSESTSSAQSSPSTIDMPDIQQLHRVGSRFTMIKSCASEVCCRHFYLASKAFNRLSRVSCVHGWRLRTAWAASNCQTSASRRCASPVSPATSRRPSPPGRLPSSTFCQHMLLL